MANPLIVKLGFGASERVTKAVSRDGRKYIPYILFPATYSTPKLLELFALLQSFFPNPAQKTYKTNKLQELKELRKLGAKSVASYHDMQQLGAQCLDVA